MVSTKWARCLRVHLQPLGYSDCSFESRLEQGCLSLVCCQREVSALGWSLIQRRPAECGVPNWAWSRRLETEETLFFLWRCDPTRVMASSFLMFLDHTQRRTTVGRTPLDEWSPCRRALYLKTHNTHNRQISMPPVGFEPTISAGKRPQTYDWGDPGPSKSKTKQLSTWWLQGISHSKYKISNIGLEPCYKHQELYETT